MAKISFFYSAMNGGKTTVLLQVLENYEEQNKKGIIVKLVKDVKDNLLQTRFEERIVDLVLEEKESFFLKRIKF